MTRLARRHGWWLIALAVFAVVCGLRGFGRLQSYENSLSDARAQLLTHEVRSNIVIVGIDPASLTALDQFPWPRRLHGKLLRQLSKAAPQQVFLDIDFSSPSNDLDDAALESALARTRDYSVLLPTFSRYRSGTDEALVVSRPLPRFARHTELAVVNREVGADGLTRNWRTAWTLDGERVPSAIDPRRLLSEDQDVRIDFSISPSSFTYLSYVDVLEGRVPQEVLAGKTVFVGATAPELGDIPPVPIYRSLPGIVIQALAAETIEKGVPRTPPTWAALVLLALGTLLTALVYGAPCRSALRSACRCTPPPRITCGSTPRRRCWWSRCCSSP